MAISLIFRAQRKPIIEPTYIPAKSPNEGASEQARKSIMSKYLRNTREKFFGMVGMRLYIIFRNIR